MKKLALIILLVGSVSIQVNAQVMTLKDSLLQKYTMEELKKMSLQEFGNVVREIRGENPLPVISKNQEYDGYGVKLIKEIPVDSMRDVIDGWLSKINKEKEGYRKEVFPNAWRDVIDGYGLRFYKNFIERIRSNDEEVINELIATWVRVTESSPFSDFTKRVYYYNEAGALRLITREVSYNIFSRKHEPWERQMEKVYYLEEYYVWKDTLQYATQTECRQYVSGYPDYTNQEQIDTTRVYCNAWRGYHYKYNCFGLDKKEGYYPRETCREDFEKQPFNYQGECSNGSYINFRNLLTEREEYYSKENDYLHPLPTSERQPYVIDGK